MKSQRILVIDDEKSIREFLTILLQQEEYEVVTAASVGEGITQLVKEQPDDQNEDGTKYQSSHQGVQKLALTLPACFLTPR